MKHLYNLRMLHSVVYKFDQNKCNCKEHTKIYTQNQMSGPWCSAFERNTRFAKTQDTFQLMIFVLYFFVFAA